jgi:hypothetical protein
MRNDDQIMDDLVQQLHACLASAMRQVRAEPFATPVTVAEIYQDLVPYRTVRSRLGFEMNADYEHTLLRMLAGEGGLARLDPREARDELRAELETPNPNVGLFRKFAACDVWVTAPREGARVEPFPASAPAAVAARHEEQPAPQVAAWVDPPAAEPDWEGGPDAPELLLEEEVVDEIDIVDAVLYEMPAEPALTPAPPVAPAAATPTPQDSINGRAMHKASGHCAFCDSALPSGRSVKYCPYCGMDQTLRPCGSCAEPLEPDWRFCIACGAESGVPAPAS